MSVPAPHFRDLTRLFASIKNEQEAAMLLKDILTPNELASITERWQLVQELAKGTPQREIAKKLKLSISKITRGSHMMQHGSGGFEHFLRRMGK